MKTGLEAAGLTEAGAADADVRVMAHLQMTDKTDITDYGYGYGGVDTAIAVAVAMAKAMVMARRIWLLMGLVSVVNILMTLALDILVHFYFVVCALISIPVNVASL